MVKIRHMITTTQNGTTLAALPPPLVLVWEIEVNVFALLKLDIVGSRDTLCCEGDKRLAPLDRVTDWSVEITLLIVLNIMVDATTEELIVRELLDIVVDAATEEFNISENEDRNDSVEVEELVAVPYDGVGRRPDVSEAVGPTVDCDEPLILEDG